jgi:hypothetical protein
MNPDAMLAIGGVVGSLSKFLMMGVAIRGIWVTLAAFALTTLSFFIWGYSHGDFARETSWNYFTAWAATLAIAAGSFHGTEEAVKKVVEVKNGTGN